MSDDIRVILIKICDRLHNMRTLESQAPNKQYKIAGETLYIYAPLANRLGLNKIKTELENLSFKFEHPEEYASIEAKLASTQEQREILFQQFTDPIRQALDQMGIQYEIKARIKSPYSIWNKMQSKHVAFEEIYDILAVRIIFTPKNQEEEINESFNIYVKISQLYKSHPDRLRDWLNHPKANGYQALHVTLMSKQGRWIEVQIRTRLCRTLEIQGRRRDNRGRRRTKRLAANHQGDIRRPAARRHGLSRCHQTEPLCIRDFRVYAERRNKDVARRMHRARLRLSVAHLPWQPLHRRKGEPSPCSA